MRTLKGLAALVALTALVVGIPAALVLLAGNPIPTGPELSQALTGIDFGGSFLMGTVLPLIAWAFWASFVYSLVVELVCLARRVEVPRLGGAMRPQQAMAGALVAAVLAIGAGSPAMALTPQDTGSAPAAVATAMATEGQITPTPEAERTYTVERGDTLWGIAEEELGQGSRWSELAAQLRTTPQADGQKLTDPDLILPGWNVELPETADTSSTVAEISTTPSPAASDAPSAQDTAAAQDAPAPAAQLPETADTTPQPAASAPAVETEADAEADAADAQPAPAPVAELAVPAAPLPGEAVPAPAAAPAPAAEEGPSRVPGAQFTQTARPAAADVVHEDAAQEEAPEWATIGGIGAFAAAGLLGIVGLRRQLQRRRRQPGQAVPMPEQDTAQLEAQLRVVAEPDQAEELDVVQRWLARWAHENGQDLPELFLVRVSPEQIALYLLAPAQLPAPFVSETEDGVVWTLAAGSIELEPDLPAAPYPSLVTVGQDDTRSQVLLDLERLGTLGIDGDPELTGQVLDAMAVELATSAWSENVTVTLVGVADGLATAVNDGRVRQIDDLDQLITQLEGKAADIRTALEEQGAASLDQARPANLEEAFAPEIVLLGLEPTPAQAGRLSELAGAIPRLGIAAVTTANPLASDWVLHLEDEDHADLLPVNQHLRPQKITPEEAARIKDLLATALQDPQDGTTSTTTIDINTVLDARPHLSAVPALDELMDAFEPIEDDQEEDETQQAPEHEEHEKGVIALHPEATDAAEDQPAGTGSHAAAHTDVPEQAEADQEQERQEQSEADTADEPAPIPPPAPADEPTPAPGEDLKTDDVESAPEELAAAQEEPAEPAEETQEEAVEQAPMAQAQPLTSEDPQQQIDLHAAQLLESTATQAPMILMLGELKLVGAQGEAPVTASTGEVSATQTARCIALAAYLALHPGASAEAVHAAFWPNQRADGKSASSSRNKLTSQTRRLLGHAEDGRPYLPSVGGEGYRVDADVLTDCQIVQSLIGDDPVKASTPALVAAMRLVRGVPFEHAKASNIAWTETLVQQMVQTICDAAHELVARSLASGHREHAQLAARVGRTVDPANESAWRDAMLAEAAAGNHTEVTRLIEKLYAYLESFEEDLEPEVETTELIEELKAHGYRVA